MSEWVNEWMGEGVNEWIGEWVNEGMGKGVNEGRDEGVNEGRESMNDWIMEWTYFEKGPPSFSNGGLSFSAETYLVLRMILIYGLCSVDHKTLVVMWRFLVRYNVYIKKGDSLSIYSIHPFDYSIRGFKKVVYCIIELIFIID